MVLNNRTRYDTCPICQLPFSTIMLWRLRLQNLSDLVYYKTVNIYFGPLVHEMAGQFWCSKPCEAILTGFSHKGSWWAAGTGWSKMVSAWIDSTLHHVFSHPSAPEWAYSHHKAESQKREWKAWRVSGSLGLELAHCYIYHILLAKTSSRPVQIQGWRNRLNFLIQWAVKLYCKWHGYKEPINYTHQCN